VTICTPAHSRPISNYAAVASLSRSAVARGAQLIQCAASAGPSVPATSPATRAGLNATSAGLVDAHADCSSGEGSRLRSCSTARLLGRVPAMADGNKVDQLDDAFGALIPHGNTSRRLLDVLKVASEMLGLGNIIKMAAVGGGWWVDDRKPDRVFPVLLALKDALHDTARKQTEYVRTDQFQDLFEETIRRIANEPSAQRREWFRHILLKILEHPKDHDENRLFLRLTDELSTPAHKVLAILNRNLTAAERQLARDAILSVRSGVPEDRVLETLGELARAGLLNPDRLEGPASQERTIAPSAQTVGGSQLESTSTYGVASFSYFLTRLGREFMHYRGA
jgi:hypothetical protein